jgi:hypothetical protein
MGGGYIFIHRMLLEYFAEVTHRPLEVIEPDRFVGIQALQR